jgi:hypothetical protein
MQQLGKRLPCLCDIFGQNLGVRDPPNYANDQREPDLMTLA